jgi:predicted nucleic acid-binding protein
LGQLSLPPSARVYLDTAPIIYSVEKHTDYWQILLPFWQSVKDGEIDVVTSELTLLEALVQPIKSESKTLISAYETLLTKTDIRLIPISLEVLRSSANLRVELNLKTPDAIHASTALTANCTHFLTNDNNFIRLPEIDVVILSKLL